MLVLFHYIISYIYSWMQPKNEEYKENLELPQFSLDYNLNHPYAERTADDGIKFDPPVSLQRYDMIKLILLDERWRSQMNKVVEFGCAQLNLFRYLKHLISARELILVDIDECLLEYSSGRIYPLTVDHIDKRLNPLNVKLLAGSVAYPDESVENADAVIAIELIEHLYPDVLEAFPYNIFSYIEPKLSIITTPNYDFNAIFGKEGFRHFDHKFEWTREQFQSWCKNITLRFPKYTVAFDGVGLGPRGTESLGSCTQLAVFIRKDIICDTVSKKILNVAAVEKEESSSLCNNCIIDSSKSMIDECGRIHCTCICKLCKPKSSFGICTYNSLSNSNFHNIIPEETDYKLLKNTDYPYSNDHRTEEEKIMDELRYRINIYNRPNSRFYNYETCRVEIPINELIYGKNGLFMTSSELRGLLVKNYIVEECVVFGSDCVQPCIILEIDMDDNNTTGDNSEASGYESDNRDLSDEDHQSDWDNATANNSNSDPKNSNNDDKTIIDQTLIDSGYQKSPTTDESPKGYAEVFSNMIKIVDSSKLPPNCSTTKSAKTTKIVSISDKINFDKVNELDGFRTEGDFLKFAANFSPHKEAMRKICHEIVKHPVAGPSNIKSKSKKSPSVEDDAKSIANCILENSLNCLQFEEKLDLIIQQAEELGEPIGPLQEHIEPDLVVIPPLEERVPEIIEVVENGDLANNNRDLEGNNYQAAIDDLNQLIHNPLPDNVNVGNNNEINNEENINPDVIQNPINNEPVPDVRIQFVEQQVRDADNIVEVAWSSREALCDSNSQVDLLEDFDMAQNEGGAVFIPQNYELVPPVNGEQPEDFQDEFNVNDFPNWLLEIFQDEDNVQIDTNSIQDEPHNFCQGDGIGVHPSIIAVNDDDDDDDDDDNDGERDTSSSNTNSVEDENGSQLTTINEETNEETSSSNLVVTGVRLENSNQVSDATASIASEQEEFFEAVEDPDAPCSK